MSRIRAFLLSVASAVTSAAFQISLAIWPHKFQGLAPYVKWMWFLSGLLFLLWLTTHVRGKGLIRLKEKRPDASGASITASPSVSVSPIITVSPNISNVSQTQEAAASVVRPAPKQPNLQLERFEVCKLAIEADTFTANPYNAEARLMNALVARINNAPCKDRETGYASQVRAALIVGGNPTTTYSPLPWLGEYWNSADLAPADLKDIVMAVDLHPGGWRLVTNRRSGTSLATANLEYFHLPRHRTDCKLQLIHRGRVVREIEFKMIGEVPLILR
jgi:hypothetical protein